MPPVVYLRTMPNWPWVVVSKLDVRFDIQLRGQSSFNFVDVDPFSPPLTLSTVRLQGSQWKADLL